MHECKHVPGGGMIGMIEPNHPTNLSCHPHRWDDGFLLIGAKTLLICTSLWDDYALSESTIPILPSPETCLTQQQQQQQQSLRFPEGDTKKIQPH